MKLFGARTLRHPRRRNNGRQSGAPPMLIRLHRAVSRPSAYHTDAGKALSFSAAGPVNGRRWRLPGMQTRDLRLLKTLKTATVASTPLAIW
jgi:hypothetical protein